MHGFAQIHNLKISFHFLLPLEHLFCIIFIWRWSKGTESFSEIEDDDFEDGLLDALAQERTAI